MTTSYRLSLHNACGGFEPERKGEEAGETGVVSPLACLPKKLRGRGFALVIFYPTNVIITLISSLHTTPLTPLPQAVDDGWEIRLSCGSATL